MKISREYGGWVTASLTFILSLSLCFKSGRISIVCIIIWIPVFIGLIFFDNNKDEIPVYMKITIVILFVISLFLFIYIIIPYSFFLSSYVLKHKRMKNYLVTLTGIAGESLMLAVSMSISGYSSFYVPALIFIYLYGAEFGVQSFIRRNFYVSLYNILPAIFFILGYSAFIICLVRLSYFKLKNIKILGVLETMLYAIIIISIMAGFKIPPFGQV
ncbi:MAG: hypothetical protein ACP5G5_04255 [Thermoplasmata archaeon]